MESKNQFFIQKTKELALKIIELYRKLPKSKDAQVIGGQLLRCGTSVGANYRASVRVRSQAERYAKLCIVIEESDETCFWIEILRDANLINATEASEMLNKTLEILKPIAAYRSKIKK